MEEKGIESASLTVIMQYIAAKMIFDYILTFIVNHFCKL